MGRERDGSAMDMVRRVVGDSTATIEALVAEGDRFEGLIVLRITERIDGASITGGRAEVVRCYEYRLANNFELYEPEHISCPDLPALTIHDPPPSPALPGGAEDSLRDELGALPRGQRTEAGVEQAARLAVGETPVFEVATVDGVIGLAIGDGDDECVFALVTAQTVEVWRVPAVIAQPGELGCGAESAAIGAGREAPH